MRMTIATRIFLALTFVSIVILSLNAVVTRWNFERGFLDYVAQQEQDTLLNAVDKLAQLYANAGSWDSLRGNPRLWNELLRPEGRPPRDRPPPPGQRPGGPPPDPLEIARRVALIDASGNLVIGMMRDRAAYRALPVVVNGQTVGQLSIAPPRQLTAQADRNFAASQGRSIWVVALAALLLAALISSFVARQLTRPVRSLAAAVRAVAAGQYEQRISVARNDELGDLARDFNQLAETLEKNRVSRRQWVADIAHELRTPLAILRGEIDAIEDGVRPFNLQTQRSLRAEVTRLTQLVGDLHDLSVVDEGGIDEGRERLDLVAVLNDALDAAAGRLDEAGLTLTRETGAGRIVITANPARLQQVFSNLIENALRYTDAPGELRVTCRQDNDCAVIQFADSAPGVASQDLTRLFDRLFRVDTSRSRDTGGSGLGLSICRSIVEAHGGTVEARQSDAGGVLIDIRLPVHRSGEKSS